MLHGFSEGSEGAPVTLIVDVRGEFNLVAFERRVFGIDPADLEPCEAPSASELVGATMTQAEALDDIDAIRIAVRPDLWAMGEDGKAQRKQ
jgi:hypothetical protein